MATGLKGWHPGELEIQRTLGYDEAVSEWYRGITPGMPDEHRKFHTNKLAFVPVSTLDASGRPWASLFTHHGERGFIKSPSPTELVIDVLPPLGDPFWENEKMFGGEERMLIAGLGIEFSTRRRNKFAGWVKGLTRKDDDEGFKLTLEVNEAIGNCPKYINVRQLDPHPINPSTKYSRLQLDNDERLPEDVIQFIQESDTVFLGTTYHADDKIKRKYPSHLGMNQRGGRTGFIRVDPNDGRTVVLPDYSGNRMMTSLGNIAYTPLACMTFLSFLTGSILYLTGSAKTLVGQESQKIMPFQNVITTLTVSGYIFLEDAFPLRQRKGTNAEPSPYSVPIRYLANEGPSVMTTLFEKEDISATLTKIVIHSNTLATFTWSTSKPIRILPGQAAIMDFTPLLGKQAYAHMAEYKPTSVNDDRIRTWTVSSAHLNNGKEEATSWFELTMRLKRGGAVTGALFAIAGKLKQMRPGLLDDTKELGLVVKLVGVSGSFALPSLAPPPACSASQDPTPGPLKKKLLWVAGGIGITPFLSMLRALRTTSTGEGDNEQSWDVSLVLACRDPDVLLPLISEAYGSSQQPTSNIKLTVDVFSHQTIQLENQDHYRVEMHKGRIPDSFWASDSAGNIVDRDAYVCGPKAFEHAVIGGLERVGMMRADIHTEGFEY